MSDEQRTQPATPDQLTALYAALPRRERIRLAVTCGTALRPEPHYFVPSLCFTCCRSPIACRCDRA